MPIDSVSCNFLITANLIFQYRPDFPDFIKERAVFLDLAPRFRMKAEDILQREIQVVIYNLKEVKIPWNANLLALQTAFGDGWNYDSTLMLPIIVRP